MVWYEIWWENKTDKKTEKIINHLLFILIYIKKKYSKIEYIHNYGKINKSKKKKKMLRNSETFMVVFLFCVPSNEKSKPKSKKTNKQTQ